MRSTSAPWKSQLEHTGAALLRALVAQYTLLSSALAAHSQVVFQPRCFAHRRWVEVIASFAWRRRSDSTLTVTNCEVALVRNSLNLVDCHGMLRAWLEQHSPGDPGL